MQNDLKKKLREKQEILWQQVPKLSFFSLLLINVVSAALFVIAPIVLNRQITEVGTISGKDIAFVILLLLAAYFVQFLSVLLKNILIQASITKSSDVLFRDIFKLQYDAYINKGATALLDLSYNAASDYANYYFGVIPDLLVSILTIVVTIAIALSFNAVAALLMLLMLPIHYFGFRTLNKKLSQLSVNLRNTSSLSFRNINSVISQVDFIKQNADNSPLLPPIRQNIRALEEVRKRVNYVANGASGLLNGLNQMIQTFVIIFLSALALQDKANFGNVVYVMLVLPYFSNGIRNLNFVNSGIAAKKSADEHLIYLIEEAEAGGEERWEAPITSIRFDIPEVKVGDKLLLENIKMAFRSGDIVGIQGESGSGKSTLAKLIPKFRHSEGIYVNDQPIHSIKNEDYLKRVAYYSQNAPIISDTLYRNLNFGREDLPKKVYEDLPFLRKFENLEEEIIEDGANLSGGDKQRIALSRFFTEAADVVILDEPSNSLDKKTEYEILSEVLSHTEDKIVFIISHNPDVMRFCTHVVQICDKRVEIRQENI